MLKIKPYDPEELRKCKYVENRYLCSICFDIFLSIDLLKLHFIDIHGYKEPEKTSDTDFFNESSDQSMTTQAEEIKPKQSYFSTKFCEICGMLMSETVMKYFFLHSKFSFRSKIQK